MLQVVWPLVDDRPCVRILVALQDRMVPRVLLADTGAGSLRSGFELILDESDCAVGAAYRFEPVHLGGAIDGQFPVYLMRILIPELQFDRHVRAVGIPSEPRAFDGIACFRFLDRFAYGNFGKACHFGLEI